MTRRRTASTKGPPSADALPEAELEILACLHELGEADAATIRGAVARFRRLSHASVATLLRRLEAKGLVSHRKADHSKAFVYAASPDATTTYRSVVKRLLDRVFRDDPLSLVASLFSVRPPSEKEARELRKLVDTLHRKSGETRSRKP